MTFPLYDRMIYKSSDIILPKYKKTRFIDNIKKLDLNGKELVYALIVSYSNNNDFEIGSNDVEFDFDTFPPRLQSLLYEFVILHLQEQERII